MLPDDIPTVTVTGRYLSPDGKALSGQIVWRAPALLTFPDSDVMVSGAVTAPLDANGAFVVALPATDAPDMDPSGWSYTVAEQLTGVPTNRVYQVLLPSDHPVVDLADLAPTDPSTPNYVAVDGKSAYQLAIEAGFVGTVEQWLASLVGPAGATGEQGPRGAAGATGEQGPQGEAGAQGAPGVVQSVNGQSAAEVVLAAEDVHAVPYTAPGAAGGVAQLDSGGKLPVEQLPDLDAGDIGAIPITAAGVAGGVAQLDDSGKVPTAQLPDTSGGGTVASVNGQTGAVVLDAGDVGALDATAKGAASGVAPLDASSDVPLANLPDVAIPSEFAPADLGLKAWAYDPVVSMSTVAFTGNGSLRFTAFVVRQTISVSKIALHIGGYAGTMNTGSWAAIYTAAGARKATTADLAGTAVIPGVHNAGGATVGVPLTASVSLAPGVYYVAYVFRYSASDGPELLALDNAAGAPPNVFGLNSVKRFGVYTATVPTTAPTSIAPASIDNGANRFWAGVA
ncbi:collagen-like protein [Streptomyces sp. 8L]|uniref:collagen-like protein n=1 Tax=Streptomyces sp. 8L TaxID=2877242 RepID=UPI001CD4244F|nr:collagen-like protein [Streptomyces sp. 8L]MCA1219882.1 collagen-like protein [Streptomyces sp. 8L]